MQTLDVKKLTVTEILNDIETSPNFDLQTNQPIDSTQLGPDSPIINKSSKNKSFRRNSLLSVNKKIINEKITMTDTKVHESQSLKKSPSKSLNLNPNDTNTKSKEKKIRRNSLMSVNKKFSINSLQQENETE